MENLIGFIHSTDNFISNDRKEDFNVLINRCNALINNNKDNIEFSKDDMSVLLFFLDVFREYVIFQVNSKPCMNFIVDTMEVFSKVNTIIKKDETHNIVDSKINEVTRIMNSYLTLNEASAILRMLLDRSSVFLNYNPPSLDLSHHYLESILKDK